MERDGVFQRKDRTGWYISYTGADGKRKKQKTDALTKRQAETVLNAIKTNLERDKVLGIRAPSECNTIDLFERFLDYQRTYLKSNTLERNLGIVQTLHSYLPSKLKDVNRHSIDVLVGKLRGSGLAPATIQKYASVLKHALRMAVEWDLLQENPYRSVKLAPASEGRTEYLSPHEIKIALEHAADWMRAPIALAAFTGMRRGELLGLRWKDVDLHGQRVYLRDTKNGTLRIVPLNAMAMTVISRLPRRGAHVLPGVDGHLLTVRTRRLFARLGIAGSFHTLRHTAASWLAMGGVSLHSIGQILGHKTPRMTNRYAHLSPDFVAKAVTTLDAAFENVISGDALGTIGGLSTSRQTSKVVPFERHPVANSR